MSASQARLLSITARMHDIELKAQAIEAQKIQLATEEDQIYQKYCDALDAKKITVAYMGEDGTSKYIDANYSTVCGYNPDRRMQYALRDNRTGHLMVSEEIKETYEDYDNDPYCFAWAMMGFEGNFNWNDGIFTSANETGMFVGLNIGQDSSEYNGYVDEGDGTYSLYMTQCEQLVFEEYAETDSKLQEKYDAIENAESKTEKTKALNDFRKYLYNTTLSDGTNYAKEIFQQMILNKNTDQGDNEIDPEFEGMSWSSIQKEFQYYVQVFNSIKEAGGCEVIDPQYTSGDDGTQWFNNMVKSGLVTIQVLENEGTSDAKLVDTSVATSIGQNYLQEEADDKDLAKAKAEYEHDMKVINRKDTKFDTELKNLETERNSLNTMLESVKKVKDDNIDRTFGIFS